jgi:hypothetical protein
MSKVTTNISIKTGKTLGRRTNFVRRTKANLLDLYQISVKELKKPKTRVNLLGAELLVLSNSKNNIKFGNGKRNLSIEFNKKESNIKIVLSTLSKNSWTTKSIITLEPEELNKLKQIIKQVL